MLLFIIDLYLIKHWHRAMYVRLVMQWRTLSFCPPGQMSSFHNKEILTKKEKSIEWYRTTTRRHLQFSLKYQHWKNLGFFVVILKRKINRLNGSLKHKLSLFFLCFLKTPKIEEWQCTVVQGKTNNWIYGCLRSQHLSTYRSDPASRDFFLFA